MVEVVLEVVLDVDAVDDALGRKVAPTVKEGEHSLRDQTLIVGRPDL